MEKTMGGRGAIEKPRTGRRELTAATVGSLVESFDWNMYAVLAPFFAVTMFGPHGSSALLAAYAGFAVGFLARPFGSVALGRFSDRFGRRAGLTLSMALISGASLGLALVPSEAAAGIWAGVLVVVLRLVQGFAFGGETSAVMAYVTEAAPAGRRFAFSAVSYSGVACGSLLAFGVLASLTSAMGRDGLAAGGWRWGFVIAAAGGLFAVWVRWRAPESEDFEAERSVHGSSRPPVMTVIREHRRAVLAVVLLAISGTVPVYFALVYLPVYGEAVGTVHKAAVSGLMTGVLAAVVLAVVGFGHVLDRFDPITVLRIAFTFQAIATVPLLWMLQSGAMSFGWVALVLGVALAPGLAVGNVISGMLFPTPLRAVGSGFGMAIGIAVFGGTLPMLAELLHTHGGYFLLPYYVAIAAVCGLVSIQMVARTPGLVADVRRATITSRPSNT